MSWKNPPTNFALEVLKQSDEHLRKVATEVLQGVIMGSPVDEGAFRSNHIVSINTPVATVVDTTGYVAPKGNIDQQTLENGKLEILKAKLGNSLIIQNNLPYAVALENGHSKQAPLGIYSIAHMNAKNKYGL